MAKEICISSTPHETRLAILEDDQLAEIYYERENEYTLAGSIYNGRVTRVLPGMQSAFVDVGLERDAFLYVTDFLELEDQEESDEIEKAAVSGGSHAPREVRRGRNQERAPRETAAPEAEAIVADDTAEEITLPAPPARKEAESDQSDDGAEGGGRRWRGRRRRRGGRGSSRSEDGQAEPTESTSAEPQPYEETHEVRAVAAPPAPQPERASTPFLLPGESLSRYGGSPAEDEPRKEAPASNKPAVTSRPSTLIEASFEWDGSGLLPGESLARHRNRKAEPEQETLTEPAFEEIVEEEFAPEVETASEPQIVEAHPEFESNAAAQQFEDEFEEEVVEHTAAAEPLAEFEDEPEPNTEASHHVDPLPPSTFRLFGFGGKKKSGDEHTGTATEATAPKAQTARAASSYSPGSGLVEEEVIEGEEFDLPRHAHRQKTDEHDLDEYEEETLQTQIRSGEIGEMLQEAHLDHRIQLNFDDKNVEEEAEDEDEDDPAAQAQAQAEGQAPARRERGGRGRRGGGRGERTERSPQSGRRGPSRRSAQTSDLPIISDLLKPGQEILVQIAKEPIAKKGARITSHIALPGRFLVFMPTVSHVGVSRKIASDEERHRLKRILVHERGEASGGFIVRTAAEGASEEELRADLRFLIHLWDEIKQRSDDSKSPALIYHDLSLIERILRDQVSSDFSNIWVDSEANYERIVRFLNRFSPSLVRRVKLYTKETPLFEHFGITDEISKALRSKVWLKSGGSIVINQTEALVAIDINTGKYVGKSARLEDTIVKTNLDAVPEIVRQVRLRDLGGIIIIDFIDMDERKNRHRVMAALEEALKSDRAPTKVLQFNDFGLVAITRKRVKQSLERTLSVPCPVCQATGMVKSPATVCNEIYVELRKMRKHFESSDILLRVNPETVKTLKANNARWLVDFEELTGKNLLVKSDPSLHPEQFDIQG